MSKVVVKETPSKKIAVAQKDTCLKRKICYIFQGGGALGAYQVGVCQALRESGYAPEMIIGISIGGINAAIIAGNKPEHRITKLKQFWDEITTSVPVPLMDAFGLFKIHNWFGAQNALMGVNGFYHPKLINPAFLKDATPDEISYYDTTPLRETLSRLIDFKYLNEKHVRLCLGTVELGSGDFIFFDSFEQEITLDHVLATGALPPAFPPVKINNKYYVDGGVFSNTPVFKLIDEFAAHPSEMENILCFMVDLFSGSGPYPHSLDGLLERIKDIQYSSHSKRPGALYATTQNLSHAINFLSSILTPEQLQTPGVAEIMKLGLVPRVDVVHLVYHSPRGTELQSKDYNFSKESCIIHRNMGYEAAKQLVKEKRDDWESKTHDGLTVYSLDHEVVAKVETA